MFQIKQGWNSRGCRDKQSNILKGEPPGFIDGWIWHVKKKEVSRTTLMFLVRTPGKMNLLWTKVRTT